MRERSSGGSIVFSDSSDDVVLCELVCAKIFEGVGVAMSSSFVLDILLGRSDAVISEVASVGASSAISAGASAMASSRAL